MALGIRRFYFVGERGDRRQSAIAQRGVGVTSPDR